MSAHPVEVQRDPLLHRKHGGCSNAEQDPRESGQHHQELHAVRGVQVTEQGYTHERLTRCVCACLSVCVCDGESVSSSDWSRAERWSLVRSGGEELVRIWSPLMVLLL